jgi:hypothetical protein
MLHSPHFNLLSLHCDPIGGVRPQSPGISIITVSDRSASTRSIEYVAIEAALRRPRGSPASMGLATLLIGSAYR